MKKLEIEKIWMAYAHYIYLIIVLIICTIISMKIIFFFHLIEFQVNQMKIIYGNDDPEILLREKELRSYINYNFLILFSQVLLLFFYKRVKKRDGNQPRKK